MHIMQENHAIKAQLISLLSWSVSCFHSNPLLLKPHNLTLSCSQPRSSSPVLKHPPLAFPLLLGPSPGRLLQENHQVTNWQHTPTLLSTPQHQNIVPPCPRQLPQLPHCRKGLPPSLAYTHSLSGLPHSALGYHKQYQVPVISS